MIDRKETGMTYSAFLIKYSEIGIKGKNRYVFEEALCARINENLSRVAEGFKVEREQGRIFLSIMGFGAGYYLMLWLFHAFMLQMDGYFAFYMRPVSMVLSVVYLLLGYAFVSVIDFIRIKKIPMDVALKNAD